MKLSNTEREQLRMMFGGKCAYCGCELPEKGWHADHVEPIVRSYKFGEMVTSDSGFLRFHSYGHGKRKLNKLHNPNAEQRDNLWPCCRLCNINKSSMPLEVWRRFLTDGPESLASYNGRFRHMMRFRVVTVNPEPLLFWFEQYTPPSSPQQKGQPED